LLFSGEHGGLLAANNNTWRSLPAVSSYRQAINYKMIFAGKRLTVFLFFKVFFILKLYFFNFFKIIFDIKII